MGEGEDRICPKDNSPVIIVEGLQLRKVTVEGESLFRSYAPVGPNLEDFPCCSLSGPSANAWIGL